MNKTRAGMKKELSIKNITRRTKNNTKSYFRYIGEELSSSTIHGLSYIFNSGLHLVERYTYLVATLFISNRFTRIFWLTSFIASISFITVLLSTQYMRFIKSPTVMSVEMNYFDWNISYPAITLCPLHKSDTTLYRQLLEETSNGTGLKTDTFFWSVVCGGMDNLDIIYLDIPENVSSLLHPEAYSKLAADIFRKFPSNCLTTNTYWNISLETAMTEVGMCHVINSNVAVYDNPLNWQKGNREYARTNIELTIYESDFAAQITNYSNNYKVYIHHPDELILTTSPSLTFDVEGFLTLGLSVWSTRISNELRAMSIPLRKCRFVNEPLNKRYPVYSYNHCLLECRIGIILQLCGCVPHFYKPLPSERVCTINELQCVRKYKKEIISLKVPNSLIRKFWYSKKLPKSPKDCACLTNCENDIYHKDIQHFTVEKSFNRLHISVTSFPKIRVVRDIIFHTNDMILRSGGVVNLFIGSSIISLIELLAIIAKLLVYFICKCSCKRIQ